MYTIKTYFFAPSLDDAYEMLQRNKTNTVLGGCGWLRMSKKRIWTAIDLTRLGLDTIHETPDAYHIGAAVTLRQLELCPALQSAFNGILPECVHRIVGVQFRNMATIGGSVFMRAGYSDLITALLSLDTEVTLYHGGTILLETFLQKSYERDILVELIIKKDSRKAAYESMRNSATDFSVLAVAVSCLPDGVWKVSVGARPSRASRCTEAESLLKRGGPNAAAMAGKTAAQSLQFGTNLRGTAEYRQMLTQALVERAVSRVMEEG